MITGARVAKPGQRRQVQGLISQEFGGSNPLPRIFILGYSYLAFWTPSHMASVLISLSAKSGHGFCALSFFNKDKISGVISEASIISFFIRFEAIIAVKIF